MKKAFAISIAFLYLVVTSGLALEIHHCMGKTAGIGLVADHSKTCSKCGMKKAPDTCCKDERKFVKLQDSHKLASADYSLPVPVAIVNNSNCQLLSHTVQPLPYGAVNINSPPGSTASLNILHCVFRV